MKTIVHFGAGNIGRSLVGTVFSKAGYRIIFVDAAQAVVDAMHERGAYKVVIKDNLPAGGVDHVDVTNVDCISSFDASAVASAVASADLIGTSVGARVLPIVLKTMAPGLARREKPVSIIFCENLHGVIELARETLSGELPPDFPLEEKVGLVATSIGKMVPIMPNAVREHDPLEVWGEAYNVIIADGQAFLGETPQIEGLELKKNFKAYVDRKLYIHNLGHATCACFGYLKGCRLICEAMEIPEIAAATRAAMESAAKALIVEYPQEFNDANLGEHVEDLLRRFSNRALGDTVFRVGRDLQRKLAADDRFVGAMRLVKATGGDTSAICRGIAAALHFAATDESGAPFEPDTLVAARVKEIGPAAFIAQHAGLDAADFSEELALIEKEYNNR